MHVTCMKTLLNTPPILLKSLNIWIHSIIRLTVAGGIYQESTVCITFTRLLLRGFRIGFRELLVMPQMPSLNAKPVA